MLVNMLVILHVQHVKHVGVSNMSEERLQFWDDNRTREVATFQGIELLSHKSGDKMGMDFTACRAALFHHHMSALLALPYPTLLQANTTMAKFTPH